MSSNSGIDNLTELAYSKFASHYSRRNYLMNEPLFNQLGQRDKEFWKALIIGIKTNFKSGEVILDKCDPIEPVKHSKAV